MGFADDLTALDTWAGALAELKCTLPGAFDTYIEPLQVLRPNGIFRLVAPNEHIRGWCDERLRPQIESALKYAAKKQVKVEFILPGVKE